MYFLNNNNLRINLNIRHKVPSGHKYKIPSGSGSISERVNLHYANIPFNLINGRKLSKEEIFKIIKECLRKYGHKIKLLNGFSYYIQFHNNGTAGIRSYSTSPVLYNESGGDQGADAGGSAMSDGSMSDSSNEGSGIIQDDSNSEDSSVIEVPDNLTGDTPVEDSNNIDDGDNSPSSKNTSGGPIPFQSAGKTALDVEFTHLSSERSRLEVEKGSLAEMISHDNLEILVEGMRNQEYFNSRFDSYNITKSTNVVPDKELTHMKSKESAEQLIGNKLPGTNLLVWEDLKLYYMNALFPFCLNLKPIGVGLLHKVSMLLSDYKISGQPFSSCVPSVPVMKGKMVYGVANGLADMLPFIESNYNSLRFEFKIQLKEEKWDYEVKAEVDGNKTKYESFGGSFNPHAVLGDLSLSERNQIYFQRSIVPILHTLFDIQVEDINFSTLTMTQQTRNNIIIRSPNGTVTASDGFVSSDTFNDKLNLTLSDFNLINMFLPMLYTDFFDFKVQDSGCSEEYMRYLSTVLHHYFNKQIKPNDIRLESLELTIDISRKYGYTTQPELHNAYVNFINSGKMVLMTPLHYDFYFNTMKIKLWREFSILSSMTGLTLNREFYSILPRMEVAVKNVYTLYAVNRNKLDFSNYITPVAFNFQKSLIVRMTIQQLYQEMAVRTMLDTECPDFYPLITRAAWVGSNGESFSVIPSHINHTLVKFLMEDYTSKCDKYLECITMRDINFTVPAQFKTLTRLVNSNPDLFIRFIPSDVEGIDIGEPMDSYDPQFVDSVTHGTVSTGMDYEMPTKGTMYVKTPLHTEFQSPYPTEMGLLEDRTIMGKSKQVSSVRTGYKTSLKSNHTNNRDYTTCAREGIKYEEAISRRFDNPKKLISNGLQSLPMFSNVPKRSLTDNNVVVTAGLHAIVFTKFVTHSLCRAVSLVDNQDILIDKSNDMYVISGLSDISIPLSLNFINRSIPTVEKLGEFRKFYNTPFTYIHFSTKHVNHSVDHAMGGFKLDKWKKSYVRSILDETVKRSLLKCPVDTDQFSFDHDRHDSLIYDSKYVHLSTFRTQSARPPFWSIHKRSYSTGFTKSEYIHSRLNDPTRRFNKDEIVDIVKMYKANPQSYIPRNDLINFNPALEFMDKGESDEVAIELWNSIVPYRFNVRHISLLKSKANELILHLDSLYPRGEGMNEIELIQYITAQSSSSFLGIQLQNKSQFALKSMIGALKSHCKFHQFDRSWILDQMQFVDDHLRINRSIMETDYGDLVMMAKTSSASLPGYNSFRDFVFQNTLDDIKSVLYAKKNIVPFEMIGGTRNDRRGKYRLIFSMNAYFRVVDYLINHGSYTLCSHGNLLSKYTTEGYSNCQMWPELYKMSDRYKVDMICIDYKGYDTQIDLNDYYKISRLLNQHRFNDPDFLKMFVWYSDWLSQPKPLVIKRVDTSGRYSQMILEYQHTLASGLHGTHSFENLYGISTFLHMKAIGLNVLHIWCNGDDQNLLVSRSDTDQTLEWLEQHFDISYEKSLVGHVLSVWGKLWFARDFHPMWEIGTVRSIWEREGGEVSYIEPSKILSNYCKILQIAITMIRLNKSASEVQYWINKLCNASNPKIDPTRVPKSLQILSQIPQSRNFQLPSPEGLNSVRDFLNKKNFDMKIFNIKDFYSLFLGMYNNRTFYTLDIDEIEYYPKNTELTIERGTDYSSPSTSEIPWIFNDVMEFEIFNDEQKFVKTVLQGSNSYDGPCTQSFRFKDMFTMAHAINDRNRISWYEQRHKTK